MASAHSHAFQRILRGKTQKRQQDADFWSWRNLMYRVANKLNPEDIYIVSRFAFAELALTGITAVGEFHYLHHTPDGTSYDNRVECSEAVIRAALDVGIRMCLLRVVYKNSSFGKSHLPEQSRFVDGNLDVAIQDVEWLLNKYQDNPMVKIGVAPHSVRAVPLEWLKKLSTFSNKKNIPFHIHVSEQQKEVSECVAAYGVTPIALLAKNELLNKSVVLVHATHATPKDIQAILDYQSFVCLCRTTERDLGDGLFSTEDYFDKGGKACFGIDSHALGNPFEEMRAAELDERSRTQKRQCSADGTVLLHAASTLGYQAIGHDGKEAEDGIWLNPSHPSLVGANDESLDDAIVFGCQPGAVERVVVNGKTIVKNGTIENYDNIVSSYQSILDKYKC